MEGVICDATAIVLLWAYLRREPHVKVLQLFGPVICIERMIRNSEIRISVIIRPCVSGDAGILSPDREMPRVPVTSTLEGAQLEGLVGCVKRHGSNDLSSSLVGSSALNGVMKGPVGVVNKDLGGHIDCLQIYKYG